MLRDAAAWWLRQMAGLAGGRLGALPDATLLFADADGELRLAHRRRGRFGPCMPLRGRVPRGAALSLPTPPCLVRDAILPLAAEPELRRVLGYQMDSLTPFRAEEIYWTWTVIARDRTAGRLAVRLMLLPRAWAAPALARLAARGITPAVLEAELPGGGICRIGLRAAPVRPVWQGGAVAAAALAAGVLLVPVLRQSWALDAAAARVAALRPAIAEVEALRHRGGGAGAGDDAAAALRRRSGDALRLLARLTALLPDDVHLTGLVLHRRHVMLEAEGRSGAATRLLAALAADPAMRDPVFTAPVLRGAQGQDVFALQTEAAE